MKTAAYILIMSLAFSGCSGFSQDASLSGEQSQEELSFGSGEMMITEYEHLTTENTVDDVINHPAFRGFGQFILPLDWGYDGDMKLSRIPSMLPYHNYVDSKTAVDTINYMIDESGKGEPIFYDIYTAEEIEREPDKADTGVFFFRGEKDAPFAVICPGGGFSYVGSIHEGFPHAIELSRRGYNAFVIQYRVGGADFACEDLAAALTFIFANAEELGVSTECYSLWGGSAGARMAAYLGSYGAEAFGGDDLPKPGTVVMQYTGHSNYTSDEPPTFVVVGENDGIASWRTMERRVNVLKSMGVDTEFHKYPHLNHGFGMGIGTSAEGWFDLAVSFWEKHM